MGGAKRVKGVAKSAVKKGATKKVLNKAAAKKRAAKQKALKKKALKKKLSTAVAKVKKKQAAKASGGRKALESKARSAMALPFAHPGLEQAVEETPALAKQLKKLKKDVTFSVALLSQSGRRLEDARGLLAKESLDDYRPVANAPDHSAQRLEELGFTIVRRGRFSLTVRGPMELLANVTDAPLVVSAQMARETPPVAGAAREVGAGPRPVSLYVTPMAGPSVQMTGKIAETIDDFVFIPPPLYFVASHVPPAVGYHAYRLDQIGAQLKVPLSASADGIQVAVIDTGFADHTYYSHQGHTVETPNMTKRTDSQGHGTAVSANVLAVAPDADLYVYRQSNPPQDALEDAVADGARVLSCSWGYDNEMSYPLLEATIRDIVQTDGVVVCFASGNGHRAWPSTMPEVLSVGGVYVDAAGDMEASNYASGFVSSLYPGRRVPDVSGLCGQKPKAVYIAMPCDPGCDMDKKYGGTPYPDGDGAGKKDGWVVASGTSSATPQVAGIVALMLKKADDAGKTLSPANAKQKLEQTARGVTKGRNAFGFPATTQPNDACGWGLVDTAAAVAAV